MPKKKNQYDFHRNLTLDIERADDETKSIPVTISTETPVKTWRGPEVLLHTKRAIDMSYAKKGLPLLDGHFGKIIGRVNNIQIKARKMVGDMIFSRSARGQEVFQDVKDKIITAVSLGGKHNVREQANDGTINVKKWTPLEVSIVSVPADVNAEINRNFKQESQTMPKIFDADGNEITNDFDVKRAREEGRKLELTRRQDINIMFTRHLDTKGVKDLQKKCKDDGLSIERSSKLLLEHLGDTTETVDKSHNTFTHGEASIDKFTRGITNALVVRSGYGTDEDKKEIGQNNFSNFTLFEMARSYLDTIGISTRSMNRLQLVGAAFTRGIIGSATVSDFPSILADVANKSMLKGYNEAESNWQQFCQIGNLSNFMRAMRPNLSEFDDLPEVPESGEYSHGKFTDLAEFIQLLTYGKLFTLSRQAIINDDMSAFTRIPASMGASAARKVADLAFGVLTANPVMNQDGVTLFHDDHGNTADLGAPSAEAFGAMKVAMALQKGPAGHASLGIRPAVCMCPLELEDTIKTLVAAQYDPATDAGTLTPNPVKDLVSVVADVRLSDDDAEQYYFSAASSIHDVVEVAFLDGNTAPFIDRQEGYTVDGVTYKVRIDAAAAPMDFRGLSRNPGTPA